MVCGMASLSGELHTGVVRDETTCLHLALKGSKKIRHNMGDKGQLGNANNCMNKYSSSFHAAQSVCASLKLFQKNFFNDPKGQLVKDTALDPRK